MKRIINLSLFTFMLLSVISCKKEVVGPQGQQGVQGVSGPEAKSYSFTTTYNAGETFKSFTGVTDFSPGDAMLFYVLYETVFSFRLSHLVPRQIVL